MRYTGNLIRLPCMALLLWSSSVLVILCILCVQAILLLIDNLSWLQQFFCCSQGVLTIPRHTVYIGSPPVGTRQPLCAKAALQCKVQHEQRHSRGRTWCIGVIERCRLAAGTGSASALRFVLTLPAAEVGVSDRLLPTQHSRMHQLLLTAALHTSLQT